MSDTADSSEPGPRPAIPGWVAFGIGPFFFGLAVWFAVGPELLDIPDKQVVPIDPAHLSIAPRRKILHDPPTINIDGYDRTCKDCHQMFPPRDDPPRALLQHSDVVLNHGINKQCRNCHDTKDRNRLVLRGSEMIGYNDVEVLCAKCHGPTYRDWQHGAHGRTNGYWDASRGVARRLRCTECHDPHNPRVPAMDPVVPLPGPDTLRMGRDHIVHRENEPDKHDDGLRDPLRRAIRDHTAWDRANGDSVNRPTDDEADSDEELEDEG